MAFAHATLGAEVLGPAVAKFVGEQASPAMRKMAAAGLAPLPPRDLLVALYQLWVDAGELADKVAKTVEGLPAPVLDGALADRTLPAGVIDFLGRKLARNERVLEQLVRHINVDDETLVAIARVCPEGICDVLAANETRWLARPAIVTSLYNNRHCRMSVIHRMLELAERQHVDLGLPAMEEIRAALAESGPVDESRDHVFRDVTSVEHIVASEAAVIDFLAEAEVDDALELPNVDDPDAPMYEGPLPGDEPVEGESGEGESGEGEADEAPAKPTMDTPPPSRERRLTQLMTMRPLEKMRTAMLGDRYDRSILIRDSNKLVSMATIKSPKIRDDEAVAYAANRALTYEVVNYIGSRRDWVKLYAVKFNLVMNPKTPMSRSMSLLGHLNQGDVQKVARSKNIPSALATAAKRKLQNRR
jgi:hypothetical protein